MIRGAGTADASAIAAIYNHYVERSVATFEEEAVGVMEMAQRIARVTETHPWLVAEDRDGLAGFAFAASWKSRSAYRYSAETTVYLAADRRGRGLGSALYEALIGELREAGMRSLIASIALPNEASIALHERFGFRHIGTFREIGRKHSRWVDVGHWQLILPAAGSPR